MAELAWKKAPESAFFYRTALAAWRGYNGLRGGEMPETVSITKPNTVEVFMKANTDLRIGADTLKEFQKQMDGLALSITKEAGKVAAAAGRTTIMAADVRAAMTAVTGSTSDLPYLFGQLEKLSAKETADLSVLIQNWIAAH